MAPIVGEELLWKAGPTGSGKPSDLYQVTQWCCGFRQGENKVFKTLSPTLSRVQHAYMRNLVFLKQTHQKETQSPLQLIYAIFVPHSRLECILFGLRSFWVTSSLFQQLLFRLHLDSTNHLCLWLPFPVNPSHWLHFPAHATSQMENKHWGKKGEPSASSILCIRNELRLTRSWEWLSRNSNFLQLGEEPVGPKLSPVSWMTHMHTILMSWEKERETFWIISKTLGTFFKWQLHGLPAAKNSFVLSRNDFLVKVSST